jgi:hypothetical protein
VGSSADVGVGNICRMRMVDGVQKRCSTYGAVKIPCPNAPLSPNRAEPEQRFPISHDVHI